MIEYEIIKQEKERLIQQIKYIKTYLSKNPPKGVEFSRGRGCDYIYIHDSKGCDGKPKRKYISIKSPEIESLINGRYLSKLLPVLERELKALQQFEVHYNPQKKFDLINTIPERFRGKLHFSIKAPCETADEWASRNYNTNPFPFNELQNFITRKGELVRSKAEYIIANLLNDMEIPYRYECELKIGDKTIYPDFTIMHPNTCKIYYLEYFGMMDNEEYQNAALRKISLYQQSEFAERSIFIFESKLAPMDIQSIQTLLTNMFLN